MKWKINILIGSLLLCVGILLGTMLTRSCQTPQIPPQPQIIRDTEIVVQIDTQYYPKPVPYKVEVHDTVYLDKPYNGHVFTQETKWFSDNSTYDMQVSGINVQLDWIKTYPKIVKETIAETKTETIYVTPKPLSFWGGIEYRRYGNTTAVPITIEARYAKKNEEYCARVGYDVVNSVGVIEASAKRRF